jgi:carboxylesterase type B
VSPLPWLRAYHSSDLPPIFGTLDIVRGEASSFQRETSEAMQRYRYAFIKDPIYGLRDKGWVANDPDGEDGGKVMRFGRDGFATQVISASQIGLSQGHIGPEVVDD